MSLLNNFESQRRHLLPPKANNTLTLHQQQPKIREEVQQIKVNEVHDDAPAPTRFPKGVEELLTKLLGTDGGIIKSEDATNGYLKLLSAAPSIQSVRDLSIILDPLLMTKQRKILDKILGNKGLQMLQEIMKMNRDNFSRIPIIRKILKILNYLAEKGTLTLEHMSSAPSCDGLEGFRDSISHLTSHNDAKVHLAARDFRDKWMPHTFRRNSYSGRGCNYVEQQAGPHCNMFPTDRRWCDHGSRPMANVEPVRQKTFGAVPLCADTSKSRPELSVDTYPEKEINTHKRKRWWDQPEELQETFSAATSNHSSDFHQRNFSRSLVTGCRQGRYLSDGESRRDRHHASHHKPDAGIPCTSGTKPPEAAHNQKTVEGMRCSSGHFDRRHLRHQESHSARRPRARDRTDW